MTSSNPLRYVLYARKSSESEDKQVASIPAQIDELKKLAAQYRLNVVKVLTEEKSAKAPGRPIFGQMLQMIHEGKADGIICWKLDRLARNPVDGGSITWMLQQNVLKHIQTFQKGYLPTDNVLMMSVEFGMANQFILDLSLNTKRGMKNKAQNGWLPHKPPIGYLANKHNLPNLSPIYNDPDRFELVRKLWDILIEKKPSLDKLYDMSVEMGLRTTKGTLYPRSGFYSLFRNPFYHGIVVWKGEHYVGKHEAMVSKSEFDLVQRILHGRLVVKAKTHEFAFTGLIRCGECGASITAEEKFKHQKNGNSHHYTYYRCSKRLNKNCSQKPMRVENLEEQIAEVLGQINIPPEFHQWAIKQLKAEQAQESGDREKITDAHRRSLDGCAKRLDSLFNMRLNGEITPEEYNAKKAELTNERLKYEELLKDTTHRQDTWLDRAEKAFSFAETAKTRFAEGTLQEKRDILVALGSNLSLKDGILEIPLDNGLHLFPEVASEVRALHNRLEPLKSEAPHRVMEGLYARNKKWGG